MEWPFGDGVPPGEDTVCFLLMLLVAVTGEVGLRGPFSSDMARFEDNGSVPALPAGLLLSK